jgi:hypothetical protein
MLVHNRDSLLIFNPFFQFKNAITRVDLQRHRSVVGSKCGWDREDEQLDEES